MMAVGRMGERKVLEYIILGKGILMKDHFKMIENMDLEKLSMQMEIHMKETGSMESLKMKVLTLQLMEWCEKEKCGKEEAPLKVI